MFKTGTSLEVYDTFATKTGVVELIKFRGKVTFFNEKDSLVTLRSDDGHKKIFSIEYEMFRILTELTKELT